MNEQGMGAIEDLARASARHMFTKLATADTTNMVEEMLQSLGIEKGTYDITLDGISAGLTDILDAAAERAGMAEGAERDALVELRAQVSIRMVSAGFALGAATNAAVVVAGEFAEAMDKDSHRSHRSHGSDG